MRHRLLPAGRSGGFTLIELMIVVTTVSIIALIAVPSYQDSIRKSRRADAIAGLTRLQQLQERYRGEHPAYASAVASMPGPPSSASPEGYYTLAVDAANTNSGRYTMTATATAGGVQVPDVKCRVLRVTMDGGTLDYSSFDAGGVEDTAKTNRCWVR